MYSRTVPNPCARCCGLQMEERRCLTDPAAGMVLAATFPPLDRSVGMFVKSTRSRPAWVSRPRRWRRSWWCSEVTDVIAGAPGTRSHHLTVAATVRVLLLRRSRGKPTRRVSPTAGRDERTRTYFSVAVFTDRPVSASVTVEVTAPVSKAGTGPLLPDAGTGRRVTVWPRRRYRPRDGRARSRTAHVAESALGITTRSRAYAAPAGAVTEFTKSCQVPPVPVAQPVPLMDRLAWDASYHAEGRVVRIPCCCGSCTW